MMTLDYIRAMTYTEYFELCIYYDITPLKLIENFDQQYKELKTLKLLNFKKINNNLYKDVNGNILKIGTGFYTLNDTISVIRGNLKHFLKTTINN